MKFIETLNYQNIIDLLLGAKHHLLISSPGISYEIAEAIINTSKEVRTIVIIDNSEESIRNGYGDIKAIEKIKSAGIEIVECSGNLISFIIADEVGYYIFPQSRIFSENPIGPNAVKIDPFTIQLLFLHFIPDENNTDTLFPNKKEAINESIDHFLDSYGELKHFGSNVLSKEFDENTFQDIKKKLIVNPPLSPDLQRKINTYTAKIQFVELKFTGGNIENIIAKLPKKAMPIDSDELKNLLLTRIKMFHNLDANPEFKKFMELKSEEVALRSIFLTPITCRQGKSILKIQQKEEFKSALDKLKKKAISLNTVLIEILEEGKLNTIDILRKELKALLTKNEPDEIRFIQKEDIKQRKLDEVINTIISSIKFPDVLKLINKISIDELYFDLTWNDFKDPELLREFEEKDIMKIADIDSIVELRDTFEIKPEK